VKIASFIVVWLASAQFLANYLIAVARLRRQDPVKPPRG
jgi:hypothetical protein